jgi:hypothetical protein
MADKDFTSLLGRDSNVSFADIAGAYLSGGRKKDNRARNVLLATLFFNAKEAQMQSKVMKNLKELEDSKSIEIAKLNKQWDKRTELQTEYDNIQKNGAFKTYQTKIEEDFKKAHLENKEIINMSSGAIADYKLNWMNNQAKKYEDDFMQRYQGIDKDITVKEEFTKPYMDYYKAQKEKIMNPKNVSLVHNIFSKIGIGNKDEELNKKVQELQNIRNLNQERIQGFTQAEIKQIQAEKVSEKDLLGLKINNEDLTTLMTGTSLMDSELNAGRLRQDVRQSWIEGGRTYEAAITAIEAVERGFTSKKIEADLNKAKAEYLELNPEPKDIDSEEHELWKLGLEQTKRKTLGIDDLTEDAIYRATQFYNIASNQNLTDKSKDEFIKEILEEDIRKASGKLSKNQIAVEVATVRMATIFNKIDEKNANVLSAINETELSKAKEEYLQINYPNIYEKYSQYDSLQTLNKNINTFESNEQNIIRRLQKEQYITNEYKLATIYANNVANSNDDIPPYIVD